MHKNTLWFIVAILCIYFSLVWCEKSTAVQELASEDLRVLVSKNDIIDMLEEGRTRKKHRHHLYSRWGFYGLAIAYLIKIKVVVVAFFVGSAVYLGLRYLWPHKCGGGKIYKEGSIVLDHPPSFANHDHIPYSLDHEHYHDSSYFSSSGPTSFEPYSGYSSNSFPESDGPPESLSSHGNTFRSKRSIQQDFPDAKEVVKGTLKNLARQMVISEQQIGEFMFGFLGLDTNGCRRRFICEMEFKSKTNPLTSLAFRVMGRSFFAKYTNDQNPIRKANNFAECAAVNAECVFIENNEELTDETAAETDQQEVDNMANEADAYEETHDAENEVTPEENHSVESNDIIEKENQMNFKAELRRNTYRRRVRGDRYLKLV